MRRSGRRDGHTAYSLLWRMTLSSLAALFLVGTAYAQCNTASLLEVNARFDTSGLSCESSGFHLEAWSRHDNVTNTLEILLIGQLHTKSWIGLGFAADPVMKNASAVLATMSSSEPARVSEWHLIREGLINSTGSQLSFASMPVIQHVRGIAYVSFILNLETTTVTPYFLLFAHGPLGSSGHPEKHINKRVDIAKFAQGPDPESGSKFSINDLRKAHAAVNILGWGVFLPTGAIIARYCRQWDPLWFYLHITFQILGFIFILAGLVTGSEMYGRLKGLQGLNSHRALGIFLFTLACLQILAVVWRPKKEAKIRRYWNWYHSWVGRLALLLAAVNVFVGIHVASEKKSVAAGYAVIAAAEIITVITLESLYWMKQRKTTEAISYANNIS